MRRTFFQAKLHRADIRGSGITCIDGAAEGAGPARRVSA